MHRKNRVAVYNSHNNLGVIESTEYYTYNSSGQLIGVTDGDDYQVTYLYDDFGNLEKLDFSIGETTHNVNYVHNKDIVDPDNTYTTNTTLFDNTNYQTADDRTVSNSYHYEINALYRLDYINLVNEKFTLTKDFIYSGDTTRITEVSYNMDKTAGHTDQTYKYKYYYDNLGNITSIYAYMGSTITEQYTYVYDDLNQLSREDVNIDSCSLEEYSVDECYTKYYEYDLRGNITAIKTYGYKEPLFQPVTIPNPYLSNRGSQDVIVKIHSGRSIYYYDDFIYVPVGGILPSLTFTYNDPIYGYSINGVVTTKTGSNPSTSTAGYYKVRYHATSFFGVDTYFDVMYKIGNPTGTTTTPQDSIIYNYNDEWLDQLIGIDGTSLYTYDEQGNPTRIEQFEYNDTAYHHAELEYQGRILMKIEIFSDETTLFETISYTYNDQGYRTSKTIGSETTTYYLQGDKVIYETNGTYDIIYTYDNDGTVISFIYNGIEYYYVRNLQNDITKIVDINGNVVVEYAYDAWGNILSTTGTLSNSIGEINPYRYRGYRYEEETDYYYLNSRFYNPSIGRFINSDGLLGEQGNILGHNMYAYTQNNPVMMVDPSGYVPKWIENTSGFVSDWISNIKDNLEEAFRLVGEYDPETGIEYESSSRALGLIGSGIDYLGEFASSGRGITQFLSNGISILSLGLDYAVSLSYYYEACASIVCFVNTMYLEQVPKLISAGFTYYMGINVISAASVFGGPVLGFAALIGFDIYSGIIGKEIEAITRLTFVDTADMLGGN